MKIQVDTSALELRVQNKSGGKWEVYSYEDEATLWSEAATLTQYWAQKSESIKNHREGMRA